MQLYILDKSPLDSAQLLFDTLGEKYSFKMLIELCQLICSAGISQVYKPIPQGKELQEFVKNNKEWVHKYAGHLFRLCRDSNIKIKTESLKNIDLILSDLFINLDGGFKLIKAAPFRYKAGYPCDIPSGTVLPVADCVTEYRKYLSWKLQERTP